MGLDCPANQEGGIALHLFRAAVYACLLSGAFVAPASAAAKPACANSEQFRAVQLRQLHYELQVAALNCRNDMPEMPMKWQTYVQRHGSALSDNARILHAYFKSPATFDRHNTVVTNRESVRVHETPGYCDIHTTLFDTVAALPPAQLGDFAARTVGMPLDVSACKEEHKKVKTAEKTSG